VECVDRAELDALAGGHTHQGIVAEAEPGAEPTLDGLLDSVRASGEPALIVVLDEVADPQNAGAVVRTAEAVGAHGVVMTLHRSAPGGAGMSRASAGAIEHLPVVRVVNLRRALERLRDAGIRTVGADPAAATVHTAADLAGPVALVLGAEGRGLRDLTRRTCDELVRIPLRGRTASLNVSAAAAVLLYEAVRQRVK
jgi:23S rRNA (guanosine2251-2'-O)-methyltransferase